MKVNAKKVIILVSMVLLLVATGCLNYFLGQKTDAPSIDPGDPTVSLNFFDAYRQEREVIRRQQILDLTEIISSEVSSVDVIQAAKDKRFDIITLSDKEFVLEGLIKAKGYEDCIVTINADNVKVVVLGIDPADEAGATIIMSLAVTQTGVDWGKIGIIPYV